MICLTSATRCGISRWGLCHGTPLVMAVLPPVVVAVGTLLLPAVATVVIVMSVLLALLAVSALVVARFRLVGSALVVVALRLVVTVGVLGLSGNLCNVARF